MTLINLLSKLSSCHLCSPLSTCKSSSSLEKNDSHFVSSFLCTCHYSNYYLPQKNCRSLRFSLEKYGLQITTLHLKTVGVIIWNSLKNVVCRPLKEKALCCSRFNSTYFVKGVQLQFLKCCSSIHFSAPMRFSSVSSILSSFEQREAAEFTNLYIPNVLLPHWFHKPHCWTSSNELT